MSTTPTPPDDTRPPGGLVLRDRAWDDLGPELLHDLVRLRVDVFVVEQDCAYAELDGRDREPGARHLLLLDPADEALAAALRRLDDEVAGEPVLRIGRVVTAPGHRGRGLARWLVDHVVAEADRPLVLEAQSHLRAWYAGAGFTVTGDEYLEDGIPHVPMRRDA